VAHSKDSDTPPRVRARYLALRPATIEKTFTDCITDLAEVIVLDAIDILPDETGFRVCCHDFHGPLPEVEIKDSGDTLVDKDRLGSELCKLVAIVRMRDEMARWLPGGRFLPPTMIDSHPVVGFKVGHKSWLGEGDHFLAAYHALHKQVVG
jgi:hypothetical protein